MSLDHADIMFAREAAKRNAEERHLATPFVPRFPPLPPNAVATGTPGDDGASFTTSGTATFIGTAEAWPKRLTHEQMIAYADAHQPPAKWYAESVDPFEAATTEVPAPDQHATVVTQDVMPKCPRCPAPLSGDKCRACGWCAGCEGGCEMPL